MIILQWFARRQPRLPTGNIPRVVTGGGLSPDESRWVAGRADFFLPIGVLSRVFRGKFLAGLRAAFRRGRLRLPGELVSLGRSDRFNALLSEAVRTDWIVHAKRPWGGPETVLKYLARYTHKAAISNRRLLRLEDGQVAFRWKDYAQAARQRTMRLDAIEFVRRFLMHVLPSGFVRIRHYGLLANRHRQQKLARCRKLLGVAVTPEGDANRTDAVNSRPACSPRTGAGVRSSLTQAERGANPLGVLHAPDHFADSAGPGDYSAIATHMSLCIGEIFWKNWDICRPSG
jgi:hypothetical protein